MSSVSLVFVKVAGFANRDVRWYAVEARVSPRDVWGTPQKRNIYLLCPDCLSCLRGERCLSGLLHFSGGG